MIFSWHATRKLGKTMLPISAPHSITKCLRRTVQRRRRALTNAVAPCRLVSESAELVVDASANHVDVIRAGPGADSGYVKILSLRGPVCGKIPLRAGADCQARPPM